MDTDGAFVCAGTHCTSYVDDHVIHTDHQPGLGHLILITTSSHDIHQQLSASSPSSSSSPSTLHSHSSLSTSSGAINISTHSSLNSLPSLITLPCVYSSAPASAPAALTPGQSSHSPACVATLLLHAHLSSLLSASDYLYAGSSSSNSIHVWLRNELHRGKTGAAHELHACKGAFKQNIMNGDGVVRALAAVASSDRVVSAHDHDNKIRVWKMSSLSQNAAPVPHSGVAHGFHVLTTMPTWKDYLRTFLLAKNYVQVRRHHKRPWIEHVDAISAMAVSNDGELLYSASWDRSIKVWRLSDFRCVESVQKAHDDAINCLVVSHDGNFVYTGSADAKVKVWAVQAARTRSGRLAPAQKYTSDAHDGHHLQDVANSKSHRLLHSGTVSVLEGHKSSVNALALSPGDGSVLYSGAGDKAIIVWERSEKSVPHMVRAGVLRGHRSAILCLATMAEMHEEDPQKHLLCSGSADATIRIWKRSQSCAGGYGYECVGVVEGHVGPVRCLSVAYSHEDAHLYMYSASLDRTLKIWRL